MEQIRLRNLLKEDEIFREWFKRPPTLSALANTPPWRLYVQAEQGGKWARGDLRTYAKAYAEVNSRLRDAWDMTLHCKPQLFKPPVVRKNKVTYWLPMPEGHAWCCYCRRAVVFRTFAHHPAVKYGCDPETLRCTICGIRKVGMPELASPLRWPAKQPSTKS